MNSSENMPHESPRRAAFEILKRLHASSLHADELLNQELSRNRLQGADRGLLTELVMGVLRHQGSLDYYLQQLVQQPLERLELPVLLLLRLGAYQLLLLDRIPAHAAVFESVELAKQVVPRAKGLVNGVLRSFQRRQHELPLPDPVLNPQDWLAAAWSVPDWLAGQWLQQFSVQEASRLAAASLETPPIVLRTNSLRISRRQLIEQLAAAGVDAEPCSYGQDAVRLLSRRPVIELPGYAEGLWAVQDEAAQLVSQLLDPQPGDRILDCCAAPGGKTTHLAQLMGDRGTVVAADLNQRRVRKISESVARLGLQSVQPLVADVLSPGYLSGELFDRVLLDAPCSGLGVIRRNPEAKWRLTPAEISRCAGRQRQLLAAVAGLVRPGGLLVYATCSTAHDEDEAVIEDFLFRHPGFVVDTTTQFCRQHLALLSEAGYLRCWPHLHGTDGFFAVRLQRID